MGLLLHPTRGSETLLAEVDRLEIDVKFRFQSIKILKSIKIEEIIKGHWPEQGALTLS